MNKQKLAKIRDLQKQGVLYEGCPESPDGYSTWWVFFLVAREDINLLGDLRQEYELYGCIRV